MATTLNRIDTLFAAKRSAVLNVYCTAGFPEADSTLVVMQALQDSGVDMIELGMPYSDPLADGPVIQQSSMVALEKGMTIRTLLEQLQGFRERISVPVILMGYLNPVMQYGFEKFCADAAAAGVDGLILPDVPMHEFETIYGPVIRKYGLHFIFLVTPETVEARVRQLDGLSTGFLYAVSSSSTTGSNKEMGDSQAYFKRLQDMELNNPVLVGFGIKDKATFQAACEYTSGAIIGTAYIKALQAAGASPPALARQGLWMLQGLLFKQYGRDYDRLNMGTMTVIIQYNAGNIQSVRYALQRIGAEAMVTDDPALIRSADKVIFPGVGEASTAMTYLKERGLDKVIRELTQPVLGICLGMQLMCSYSEENDTDCLGIFEERIRLFRPRPQSAPPAGARGSASAPTLKVPQIGWNTLQNMDSVLFDGLPGQPYVYFVHSYYASLGAHTIALTDYVQPYSAALHRDNFYGVQFHPEKSAEVGETILKNFIAIK